MQTLKEMQPGEKARVKKVTGFGPIKRRIMEMGITKGVDIVVRRVAPFGDPIEITVRGYELTLRKADAAMIEVEACDGGIIPPVDDHKPPLRKAK
jgi:ferrous iron transport protein A